jgi:hypothetical protein
LRGLIVIALGSFQAQAQGASLEPFKREPRLFGFEWEVAARVANTSATAVFLPPTKKGQEFARVGHIAWTTDYEQICTKTLELITDPVRHGDFDLLVEDFRTSLEILRDFRTVEPQQLKCRGKAMPVRVLDLTDDQRFKAGSLPDFRLGALGDTAMGSGFSQHTTFPVRFGRYHKDLLQHALRAERVRTARDELEQKGVLDWNTLDDEARDTWILFLMAIPVKHNKNDLSPMPRSEVRDLFHAVRDPSQRAKFALLRRYCPGGAAETMRPRVTDARFESDYRTLWDEYCDRHYFGEPDPTECQSIQLPDEYEEGKSTEYRLCDGYGARPDVPYKPFIGDDQGNVYFLVEERLEKSVARLKIDDPQSIALVKGQLLYLLYSDGKPPEPSESR